MYVSHLILTFDCSLGQSVRILIEYYARFIGEETETWRCCIAKGHIANK